MDAWLDPGRARLPAGFWDPEGFLGDYVLPVLANWDGI